MIIYLTFDQIVKLDQRTVTVHGGNFVPPHNLLHVESLHYLLEAVEAEMFGQPMYPTIADKAALYMHAVISNHIFQDGNKRVGLGSALIFLKLNDHQLMSEDGSSDINPNELFEFTMAVASGEHDLESVRTWFQARVNQV